MALANEVSGDGILTSSNVNVRVWKTYASANYQYVERTLEQVREWVALTQSAAQTAAEAASQAGLADGAVASYSASEDNRIVGSYKLTKTITGPVITTREEIEDPPEP